jgi:ketosteroid isomerase-like protein
VGRGAHPAAVARTTPEAIRGRIPLERLYARFPALGHLAFSRVLSMRPSRRRDALLVYGFRRGYAAYNRRDWVVNTLHMDQREYVFRFAGSQRPPGTRETYRGVEGYLEFIEQWIEVIDANRFEIESVTGLGSSRVLGLSRHYGEGAGSGLSYATRSADLHEFRQGRVVRQTFWVDRQEALRELGVDAEQ